MSIKQRLSIKQVILSLFYKSYTSGCMKNSNGGDFSFYTDWFDAKIILKIKNRTYYT